MQTLHDARTYLYLLCAYLVHWQSAAVRRQVDEQLTQVACREAGIAPTSDHYNGDAKDEDISRMKTDS